MKKLEKGLKKLIDRIGAYSDIRSWMPNQFSAQFYQAIYWIYINIKMNCGNVLYLYNGTILQFLHNALTYVSSHKPAIRGNHHALFSLYALIEN